VATSAPADKTDTAPGSKRRAPVLDCPVLFLLTQGDERPQKSEPAAAPRPSRGEETVLVVDDERAVRLVVARALRRAGYAVLEAGDGRDALAVFERHPGPIDLLVTDVVMPHLGGGELAGRLTATDPGLRVLFVSGYTDDEVVRRGVFHDGVHFLAKPLSAATLIQKVREVLDAPA
jgi:CheY-like chemotaxis protein